MSTYRKLGLKLATLCMLIAVVVALPKPAAADACTIACQQADLACQRSCVQFPYDGCSVDCFDNYQACLASCP
jgi:hypothetical protein